MRTSFGFHLRECMGSCFPPPCFAVRRPAEKYVSAVFEPAQLPQETICPSVAFAKGQIGNSRGQSIIYYNINTVFVLSNKLSFCCPRKNKTLLKQCCGCGKCKFSFIFTVCKFTLINQTETCCVIAQLNIHLSAL